MNRETITKLSSIIDEFPSFMAKPLKYTGRRILRKFGYTPPDFIPLEIPEIQEFQQRMESIVRSCPQTVCFNHSGNIGDILYSLPFVKEITAEFQIPLNRVSFHIQLQSKGEYFQSHPYGSYWMTKESAEFLFPLLDSFGFKNVTFGKEFPDYALNLDAFRFLKINFSTDDIRAYYYQLSPAHLPQDFTSPLFHLPEHDLKLQDKILLIHTTRYQNPFIDQKILECVKDRLLFIGLPQEHKIFCHRFFDVEYLPVKDALDVAQKMMNAKGVIANPSGLFAIAEALKVPRILISADFTRVNDSIQPGPVNNFLLGGYHETIKINDKLLPAVIALLQK